MHINVIPFHENPFVKGAFLGLTIFVLVNYKSNLGTKSMHKIYFKNQVGKFFWVLMRICI